MWRFWIGISLMLALLGAGIYSAWAVNNVHTPIAETLEQAASVTDQAAANALLAQALSDWERHWYNTAVVTDHAPMEEVDGLFAQAKSYGQTGKMEDFAALCMRIAQYIRATAESHKPTWWNLL